MKKETTNTFSKGMVKDFHPLTTSNDVLTDALNATFITYNGNENILQNDMGNAKLSNAFLKSGYVPVGMKEHGGIIYVAAWDPKNKKGLVGSFPSPQLLWEDENWTINTPSNVDTTVSISSGNFYEGDFIKNETLKLEIFTNSDGEARTFHPGDKFIVKLNNKEELRNAVNDGYLSILLGVIKSDGGIEIMKTWDKDSSGDFLYDGDSSDLKSLLKTSEAQVFDASSSGQMLIIFNLHTLDSFNLIREYSLELDKIVIKFTGEGTKDGVTYSSSELDSYLKLSDGNTSDKAEIVVKEGVNSGSISIYPNVPFGIVQRMGRNIPLNFDKIRKQQDEFGEWRFFVMPTYMKIGWAYDFYNLDRTKEIDYIRMYFHKLEDGYTTTNKETLPHIDFQKEYYSGNFEDYINYSDIGIKYKNIYIVEIVKKFKDTGEQANPEETIAFKMLYLSLLYNDLYNGFYKNNAIGNDSSNNETPEFKKLEDLTVNVKFDFNFSSELKQSKTLLIRPKDSLFEDPIDTSSLRTDTYITPVSDIEVSDLDEYLYITKISNTLDGVLKVNCSLQDLDDKYIGKPKEDLINQILSSYQISNISLENNTRWNSSTNLKFKDISESRLESPDYTAGNVNEDGILEFPITNLTDYRIIQGKASDILTTPYESKGLQPLYSLSYTTDRKNKLAPYWSSENTRCLGGAGEDENGIFPNCTITKSGNIIEGDTNSGGGFDDGGLHTASNMMGNPMTNIFSGLRGEEAELCFGFSTRNNIPDDGWNYLNQEGNEGGIFLDKQGDNYLIACWKFTDGDTKFVNLITPRITRNENIKQEDFVTRKALWPRLDVVMRCILSLIFVVNKITKTAEYIIPDQRYYQYLEGETKMIVSFTGTPSNSVLSNIMVSDEGLPLDSYLTSKWRYSNGCIFGDSKYPMLNLIPTINVSVTTPESLDITIPNYYDLDDILQYYLGISYTLRSTDDYDPKLIYKLDIDSIDTSSLVVNIGGDYDWKITPKCVPITSTNEDLEIFRWNNNEKITFKNFFNCFVTTAKLNDWDEVPDGEENEVLAQDTNFWYGYWTNADVEDAPDLYYKVLFSQQISAFTTP